MASGFNLKKLAFLHLPKCAGTSVDGALRDALGPNASIRINPIACRKSAEKLLGNSQAQNFFVEYPKYQEFLLAYHLECGFPYVSGHVPVTTKLLDKFSDGYDFVTVLRNPTERWISHYIYNKLNFDDALVAPCRSYEGDPADELQEILTSWRGWQLGHIYTVLLSGFCPSQQDVQFAVSNAKKNLSRFRLIGFITELDEFIMRLGDLINHHLKVSHLNVTAETTTEHEYLQQIRELFTPSIRQRIDELCADDYAIYAHALNTQI